MDSYTLIVIWGSRALFDVPSTVLRDSVELASEEPDVDELKT